MSNFLSILEEDLRNISDYLEPIAQDLSGKTLLITGANGFLPSYLVETILYLNTHRLKSPCRILAWVRNREKASQKFLRHRDNPYLEFIGQDVCEPYAIPGGVDFIIHAASQASPKYYSMDPVGTFAPNVLGTYNLLKIAVEKKVKSFLYFSSSEIYGAVPPDLQPLKEDVFGPVNPTLVRSCYAESKRAGENLCVSFFHQFRVPVKIVRPFHTYGPGMALDDGRVFSDFVRDILSNQDIQMKSKGDALRAYCYLSDATKAFFTCLLKGTSAEAYNVGNPEQECSVLELAQKLVKLFPEKKLTVKEVIRTSDDGYLASSINRSCPNIEKIQLLGWVPEYSISEGFKRTVCSFL